MNQVICQRKAKKKAEIETIYTPLKENTFSAHQKIIIAN